MQAKLDAQVRRHCGKVRRRAVKAPLVGKLFDAAGEPMSPTTSCGKSGKKYRYYVSASLQQGLRPADGERVQRVSAPEIEKVTAAAIERWIRKAEEPFAIVRSICLGERGLHVAVDAERASVIALNLAEDETILDRSADTIIVLLPIKFATRGSRQHIVPTGSRRPQPDPVLITALCKAHAMLRAERGLPVMNASPPSPYDRNILRLAFLAPDIQRAILDGRQPLDLNLEKLKGIDIPLAWSKQRQALGFGETGAPCSGEQIP